MGAVWSQELLSYWSRASYPGILGPYPTSAAQVRDEAQSSGSGLLELTRNRGQRVLLLSGPQLPSLS